VSAIACGSPKSVRLTRDRQRSEWARAYYDEQRARGHRHRRALRALGAKWLKIIFIMWQRHVPYSEEHHLATMTRQALRHPEKKIA
jgi:hypothetical protein